MNLKLLKPDQNLIGGSGASFTLREASGRKSLIKSIGHSPVKASKLNLQYEWLAQRQNLEHIAKVSELSRNEDSCRYSLRYYEDYETLDDLAKSKNKDSVAVVLRNLLKFMNEEIYWDRTTVNSPDLFNHYIQDKLLKKVLDCSKTSTLLRTCLSYDEVVINGVSYLNFYQCYEKLLNSKLTTEMNRSFVQCHVHGDLTFENILVDPSNRHFILIDLNVGNDISSPIIDYAKLMQSGLSKYERMKDLFDVQFSENELEYPCEDLAQDEVSILLKEQLEPFLSTSDKINILLHEAIHFSRMLPYRQELNPGSFPVYFGRMIQLLNHYIAQIELS